MVFGVVVAHHGDGLVAGVESDCPEVGLGERQAVLVQVANQDVRHIPGPGITEFGERFVLTVSADYLRLSDDDIAELNIPTGIPLVYRLDANFKPTVAGGEYLDPEAAAAGAAAVAAQGKK